MANVRAVEVERKFLVAELPDLDPEGATSIEQGYLAVGEESEVRLRRAGGARLLTAKRGSGLSRDEQEIELEAGAFERLWAMTEGRRLRKRRHVVPLGEHQIEVDVYEGDLRPLVIAEVEFGSEGDAGRFEPPPWIGREVTGDRAYLNESLALRGAPS